VISVRSYWILPNRDQRDDLLACDGEKVVPLRQLIEPRLRPGGFSHGVPSELLEKCGPKQLARILFAQSFPNWRDHQRLFSVLTPAGVDSSGRVVHLGVVFILDPHERPSFDLSYAGLPEADQAYARALLRRLASPRRGDSWAHSVLELIELPAGRGPATNVELQRALVPFYSLYALGPSGLIKSNAPWRKLRSRSVIVLIVLAVLGVCLCERACHYAVRPSVSIGAITWRFS